MLTRILTALIALAIFIPLMVFGGIWVACALFAVVTAFSVYEMLECCGLKEKLYITVPAMLLSAIVPLSVGVGCMQPPYGVYSVAMRAGTLSVALLCVIFVATLGYNKVDAEKLYMFFGLAVYIVFGFYTLLRIRSISDGFLPDGDGVIADGIISDSFLPDYSLGLKIFAFAVIIAWGTDTFAYFTGMFFGKTKLCPAISPKKTVAGAVGGTLLGSAAGAAFILLSGGTGALCVTLACCSPLFSIVSQFGDLAASVIKRKFGVKDYGKIFPGHGGVLDRFDSVLAVSIAVYLVYNVVSAI